MKTFIHAKSTIRNWRKLQSWRAEGMFKSGDLNSEICKKQRMKRNMMRSYLVRLSGSWQVSFLTLIFALSYCISGSSAHAQVSPESSQDSVSEGASDTLKEAAPGLERQRQEIQDVSNDNSQDLTAPNEPQPDEAEASAMLPAGQIISILQQEPEILQSVKEQVAQQLGTDPSSISDQGLYQRIRSNPDVRSLASKELSVRGFSSQLETTSQPRQRGSSSKNQQPTRTKVEPYENPNDPQVQHRTSPYQNLPSLTDLYSQFAATQPKLRRFGSDTFVMGTGNTNQLPLDIPVGPDYVLGPGDNLVLNLWGGRSDRLGRTVDRQGQVEVPEVGTIAVGGLTIAQAEASAEKALNRQFHNEHIEISLGRVRTVRVYVVGDVQRPGAYDVSALSTPLSALYSAGGPTARGSLRLLRQFRDNQLVREFDLYDFLLRGLHSNEDRLLPGDTLLVPPVGPQVSLSGMVHRPAIYELKDEQGLDKIIDLAGGLLVSANLKQVNIERIDAHQGRSMTRLDLPDDQAALKEKLAAFKIKDGDSVSISQIVPYSAQSVYLDGHVLRPGKFPYRDGMNISDLLHSFEDVLPEPADQGELIRLEAPDYRPKTISFNLRDVLIGNENIPLRPFDVIRIYGRYEQDSPTVVIQGEVIHPGTYPMSQGMSAADLVMRAGGFKRSAFRAEADVTSYTIESGKSVTIGHRPVEIEKALAGDKSADEMLKPGDVVSIRRLSGWQDIGSSIIVGGEVMHAGTYGIANGERLSSVLKRAGGFTESAYPFAATFERVRVRELGEQARLSMIERIEDTPVPIKGGNLATPGATTLQDSLLSQKQEILRTLRSRTASGRMVIRISSDISSWENTSADIEVRAGDVIRIPKRPSFVSISGQVYNPVAINYTPGKKLEWYLQRGGGPTPAANRKGIYVLRADGTVVPQPSGFLGGGLMGLRMKPGDTIFVPEKIVGGSVLWQNILGTAQIMSASLLPLAITGVI